MKHDKYRKIFKQAGLAMLLAFSPVSSYCAVLDVGLIDQDRPPYFMKPTPRDSARGMYIDILDEIGRQTGITFRYKFLPQKRVRAYVKSGLIDLEPGIDSRWRSEAGEAENSAYSDILFDSKEVLVYNREIFTRTPTVTELYEMRHCKVLGFGEPESGTGQSDDLLTEKQILDLISIGRCDWAIFPLDVFYHKKHSKKLAHTPPVVTYNLRLRLNIHSAIYIEDINKAIKNMKSSGKLTTIINSYREN